MSAVEAVIITLSGDPIPKKRIRCGCLHGHGHAYDVQKKDMDATRFRILDIWNRTLDRPQTEIGRQASEMCQGSTFVVNLYFYMPIARSLSSSQKNAKLWGLSPCNEKPDFDNLAKFYTDCCTGILWKDDRQIVKSTSWKVRYSENPRTEIEIMSKKELTLDEKEMGVVKLFSPSELEQFCMEAGKLYCFYQTHRESFKDGQEVPPASFFAEAYLRINEFAANYAEKLKKVAKL